jgi:G3E family GTPase
MIPTILLTGFLGAGKTTLLNRLIEHYQSKRTVLLINEFGKVGIDGELLVDGNYDKIELNKGSLFCICVRTDFIFEVEKIATQIKPELLIIEATGLADTSEMEKMLALPNLKNHIQLRACICLIDCQNFLKIKDILRSPVTQIQSADLVLLNKIDLVTESQIEQVASAVKSIAPDVPILQTQFAEFSLSELEKISHPAIDAEGDLGEGRPDPVASITLEAEGNFTHDSWDQFRKYLGSNLMRMKGFISIDQKTFYVDATMDQFQLIANPKKYRPKNRLVIIGRRLDEDQIQANFIKALQRN